MKMRLLAASAALMFGSASFAADIQGTDVNALNDGMDTVMVPLTYAADGSAVSNIDLSVTYNPAELTYNNPGGACPSSSFGAAFIQCNEAVAGTILISGIAGGTFTDGNITVLEFDVAAVPDPTEIEPTVMVTACTAGQTCTVVPTANADTGSFEILAAAAPPASILTGAPATANLTAPVNGSVSQTFTFTASAGNVTGVSCAADAGNDPQVTFNVGGVPASVTDGNSFSISGSCGGSAITADASGSATCTYTDSASMTQMETVAIADCDVEADVAVPAFVPGNNGTLTVGPVEPGGTGSSNIVFSETANAGTGYTIDSCTLDGGSAASFSLNGPTSN